MIGNVYERCQDWYEAYPAGSVTDPQGAVTGSYRVFRSGCWYDVAGYCRSALRNRIDPDYWENNIGFRVLLAPGQ